MKWKKDYYTFLGVARDASLETIARAYREKANQYHPDKYANSSKEEQTKAQEMMQLANEAYEVLSNKRGEKASYDAWWEDRQLEDARKKVAEAEAKKREEAQKLRDEKKKAKKAAKKAKGSFFTRIFRKVEKSDKLSKVDEDFRKFQLNRTEKGGTLKKPLGKIVGITVAGVALTAVVGTGIYFLVTKEPADKDPIPTEDLDKDKNRTESTTEVYDNWIEFTEDYDKDTIDEVIKSIHGEESSLSLDQTDEILSDMVNRTIVPSVNQAINGTDEKVAEINLSSLIDDGTVGKEAVIDMESYLNSMISDPTNGKNYARRAFEDEARIIGEDETVGGLTIAESEVSPSVRYIWSRLAIATNTIADARGYDISVEINGNTYTIDELDDATLENIATEALKDMGSNGKRIGLN